MQFAIAGAFFLLVAVSAAQAQQQPAEGRDPNAPSAPQPASSATSSGQKKGSDAVKAAKVSAYAPPCQDDHEYPRCIGGQA